MTYFLFLLKTNDRIYRIKIIIYFSFWQFRLICMTSKILSIYKHDIFCIRTLDNWFIFIFNGAKQFHDHHNCARSFTPTSLRIHGLLCFIRETNLDFMNKRMGKLNFTFIWKNTEIKNLASVREFKMNI